MIESERSETGPHMIASRNIKFMKNPKLISSFYNTETDQIDAANCFSNTNSPAKNQQALIPQVEKVPPTELTHGSAQSYIPDPISNRTDTHRFGSVKEEMVGLSPITYRTDDESSEVVQQISIKKAHKELIALIFHNDLPGLRIFME